MDEVEGDGLGQEGRQGGKQPLQFGRVNTRDEWTRKVGQDLGVEEKVGRMHVTVDSVDEGRDGDR